MLSFKMAFGAGETGIVSLNGRWAFKADINNMGEKDGWFSPEYSRKSWDSLSVPGNWDLENEYVEFAGTGWYATTFSVPTEWQNKAVQLVFESVYNDSKIWLNGKLIGENHLGFLPFQFNVMPNLKYGTKNILVVSVNNTFKRGAIWNWGGIRRPVWLEITEPQRIDYQHITAIPDLSKGTAVINVAVFSKNYDNLPSGYDLTVSIEKDGKPIVSKTINKLLSEAGKITETNVSFVLQRPKVQLWDFDHPNLYTSVVELKKMGKVIHQISNHFGIRKIEVDGIHLKLNGEVIRPVGFNLVAEDRATGNTLPFYRIKQDVDMLKELGVNMARLSHLPLPSEFLDYLDEKGILVFEEVSLWGKDKWVDPDHPMPKEWLSRMVKDQYNHPSIIGWSVGNEIGNISDNPKVMEYVKGAIAKVKSIDPNRLAIYVSHSAGNQDIDPVQYADMIFLNTYGGWGKTAANAWEKHHKPIFVSEYGKELNNEDPDKGIIKGNEMLKDMRGREYLIGASLWTFNDYRSNWFGGPGWATPPSQNRCWGIVTTFRQKKRSWYEFRKEYAPVRDLIIELKSGQIEEGKNFQTKAILVPREKLDIPAYKLDGYQLEWNVQDKNGNTITQKSELIKTIYPGDEKRLFLIDWTSGKDAAALTVILRSPLGYNVADRTVYFSVPESPEIRIVNSAQNGFRVVFGKVKMATGYVVEYGTSDFGLRSDTTIDNFIELTDKEIHAGTTYQVRVRALNDAGMSQPSKVVSVAKDEDELPPVIWDVVGANRSGFIGYSVTPYDYLYEVEYGYAPGKYDHHIGLKNKGVCKIPNLENDRRVYLRMRCRKQWGFTSEWTQEESFMPKSDANIK